MGSPGRIEKNSVKCAVIKSGFGIGTELSSRPSPVDRPLGALHTLFSKKFVDRVGDLLGTGIQNAAEPGLADAP